MGFPTASLVINSYLPELRIASFAGGLKGQLPCDGAISCLIFSQKCCLWFCKVFPGRSCSYDFSINSRCIFTVMAVEVLCEFFHLQLKKEVGLRRVDSPLHCC